jgi:hypothetical protein
LHGLLTNKTRRIPTQKIFWDPPYPPHPDNAENTDIVEKVEMERSEDKSDNDDPREEDDREHFIKEDGFKDDPEDTADEEIMKQDEVIKTQEISKKELKGQEGGREDTSEDETDEEDITKKVEQCPKSLGCRLIDAVKLKNNPDGKHDEVNVLRERVNISVWKDRFDKDSVGHGSDDNEEKTVVKYRYEKPEGRDGMTYSNQLIAVSL